MDRESALRHARRLPELLAYAKGGECCGGDREVIAGFDAEAVTRLRYLANAMGFAVEPLEDHRARSAVEGHASHWAAKEYPLEPTA
jgi:hypothetical protein